jgi:hypothetical protein
VYTRWFKYDRDYLCVNKSQFVPVIFEPPCVCVCVCVCVYIYIYRERDLDSADSTILTF